MKKSDIKEKIVSLANRHELTREMLNSYGVRTVVFAIFSFAISTAYGAYNFTLAILNNSLWYGALAIYYILIACMRGGVIVHHRKKRKARRLGMTIERERIKQIKTYCSCGVMLVLMMVAISLSVMQMIRDNNTFEHTGIMIYASATYTFYKITVAIINLVKAKKKTDDLTVQAIRNINMADALVSMLALQTSLLHAFSEENGKDSMYIYTLNGVTGAVVCFLVLGLGIYMIINSQKKLRIEKANRDDLSTQDVAGEEELIEESVEESKGDIDIGE